MTPKMPSSSASPSIILCSKRIWCDSSKSKSGGSQLNEKQRRIRNLIKDKKVTFEVMRITDEEVNLRQY